MLITPGSKPRDELIKRYKLLYNETIPNKDLSINCMITTGLLNRKDIKTPSELAKLEALWATYDVCLVDEAEYTMNDSGEFIYDRLTGLTNAYSFSATSDKKGAEMISFINGLSDVVVRNKALVKYFGPSLVYRMPLKMKVDNITILTSALDHIGFTKEDFSDKGNVYLNVMNRIWTDPSVCSLVVRLVKKFPKLFIPINNLTTILNEWIDNYFKKKFKILLICGEGYIYYDLSGKEYKKDLQESCDLIKNNEVDVILSTAAGYRALDLPGLESIFLPASNIAGVVLQCIGRVARGTHMNIISLASSSGKKIPVYTKSAINREEMMKTYYKYCEVVDSTIYDTNL